MTLDATDRAVFALVLRSPGVVGFRGVLYPASRQAAWKPKLFLSC